MQRQIPTYSKPFLSLNAVTNKSTYIWPYGIGIILPRYDCPPFRLGRQSHLGLYFPDSGCAHALRDSAKLIGNSRFDFILGDGAHAVAPLLHSREHQACVRVGAQSQAPQASPH